MNNFTPKTTEVQSDSPYGVCLWEMPDGGCLGDGERFLSLNGRVGDKNVEARMRKAVIHYMGDATGQPKWMPGRRQVSDMEYDVQNERFANGLIPDEAEAARQIMRGVK